jgi:hypothetical protein
MPKLPQQMGANDVEDDSVSAPYRRLWVWVIAQAVMEATGHGMNGIERKYQPKRIAAAIEWLTTESDDLHNACDLAGLSYSVVLEKSRKRFLKGGSK